MLNEGFFYNAMIGAAVSQSDHQVSNDATDSYGNEKGDRTKNEQRGRRPRRKLSDDKAPTDVVDEMLQIIKERDAELEQLKEKYEKAAQQQKKAAQQVQDIQRRSNAITEEMAKAMNTKGNFDNVNDGLGKLDIADKFINVYDREWAQLSRWLAKQFPEKSELELIQSLTLLMKTCYKECVYMADKQLRQFMFLDESQNTPPLEHHGELFAIRKRYAQTDTTRSKIKQIVLSKVCNEDRIKCFLKGDKDKDTRHLIHDFLNKYVDCCWLMVVSNPPLALNFEVVGKEYCEEHFKSYSAKQRHVDGTNLVREVVWPCVYYADRSSFCKKGDAFVGVKDAKSSSDCGNSDDCGATVCTCFTTDENTADSQSSNADQIKDSATSDNKRSSSSRPETVTDIY